MRRGVWNRDGKAYSPMYANHFTHLMEGDHGNTHARLGQGPRGVNSAGESVNILQG